jgi:hypothetical protein
VSCPLSVARSNQMSLHAHQRGRRGPWRASGTDFITAQVDGECARRCCLACEVD